MKSQTINPHSVFQHPRPSRMRAARMALVLLAATLAAYGPGAAGKTSGQEVAAAIRVHKILFLGNSITRHAPAEAIGWSGDWGMAASAKEKDFVHRVTHSLARVAGETPQVMIQNVAEFERQYATYDADVKLKDAFAFRADLVIVAIGENVPPLDSEASTATFRNSLLKLLRGFANDRDSTIVVRSCFWPNPAKDQVLKQVCQEVGGTFVDIGQLAQDEANFARSERKFQHSGVAAHPGDRGMQAIADAVLGGIRQHPINAQR